MFLEMDLDLFEIVLSFMYIGKVEEVMMIDNVVELLYIVVVL